MTTIYVQVFGPQLLRCGLQALLASHPQVSVAEEGAQVALLCGPAWVEHLHHWRNSPTRSGAGTVLIAPAEAAELVEATRLGVSGLIGLDDAPTLLLQALQEAAAEQGFCSPRLYPRIQEALRAGARQAPTLERAPGAGGYQGLSDREQAAALHAARGLTNKKIGAEMHLSVSSVKIHLQQAYGKLGISRRGQLHEALAAQYPELLSGPA